MPEGAEATRTARVGTVTHRLEKCLASHIDGAGDRVLWLIRTKPFGGYNVAYLILNYDTGIKEALRLQVSKRELPELLAKAQEHLPLIELDPIYGQHLVALAYTWNQETGTPVPEDFFLLLDVVGEPNTRFERPIIYAALSEADLQEAAAYRDRPAEILELPEFAGWTLPDSVTQKYGDRLRDIEESPLVVSEMTQQERIQEVYAQALEEVLDDRTRRLMQLRLEEMAYYLLRTGRRREALRAVAAARSLAEDDPQRLKRNPFVTALLERSLQRAKERPSRRIILPYTPPRPTREPEEERRLII
ncbi:MAG: hypothetical protein KatS3mg131_1703 [Candidatus Tectimicrobiota bacterium]|nr:MAG: hypothetical protein KatS3mg131_1703 [Candidatus Tectomicrobia bacterium]